MAFGADERGVSAVVGATLIFGFLILFLALHQATVVPNQNQQVEFDHSQAVQRDMVEVRNAILETAETGRNGYAAVTLGTTYPARTLGINPPPPAGTLRTTANHSFAVSNGTIDTGELCPGEPVTRFLVYEPTYHVYADGPDLVYENSVVYEEFSTGSVVASDQTLVRGAVVSVVPLQRPYSRTGIKTVTVEPKAGRVNTTTVEDPVVEVPTRLSNDTWVDLLAGEVEAGSVDVTDGNLTLALTGEYTVECGPVGANDVPTGGIRPPASLAVAPVGPRDASLVADPPGSDAATPALDAPQP